MINQIINFIEKHCKCKVIGPAHNVYLTRYYIIQNKFFGLYLHRIHRADNDRDLHNHPWAFAVAYILKGGYTEQRLSRNLELKNRSRGGFNFISGPCFHRIAKVTPNLYTLFFRGPRVKEWGFLTTNGGKIIFKRFQA